MSKSLIKVKGRVQDLEKKEKNKKPIHSNYLITVNTNQQYKNDENLQNDVTIFDEIINNLLNNIDQYIKLPDGIPFDEPYIKDVTVDYVVEVGDIKKQIHTHIMIKITHFTKVQLQYLNIKQDIKEALGLDNIYFQSKLLRQSASDNILDYLSKMTSDKK